MSYTQGSESTSGVVLVFPHQLFETHEVFQKSLPIYLFEEFLFFSQYKFHKKKLVLHRASMKAWASDKMKQGLTIHYVEAAGNALHDIRKWLDRAADEGFSHIHIIDPADDWLYRRIVKACEKNNLKLSIYNNPDFLNSKEAIGTFFQGKKHYHQTDFYIAQRKAGNLLLGHDGKPLGGKWTFDAENRERFPENETIPRLPTGKRSEYLSEASLYVDRFFPNNYGDTSNVIYPYTRKEALKWLDTFLEERFEKFGIYEDAMVAKEHFLYHSVLTPMLNIGLLLPAEIIEAALQKASEKEIPLNSLEGFIRQIVGWREFIRMVYEKEGRVQRTKNFWGFSRKIPLPFWKGETGIVPVDVVIKKVLQTGYNHHIERLMVLGNFFLLCEFDPDEVYRWFMEMYIDAYDWVMVPNVYGMTQFADGGLMTTKPYISGSNYLMKMGDWPKGDWQQVWDGLFWRFMHVHRDFFLQNPRLGMLVKTFDKMGEEKRMLHLKNADSYLEKLDAWNKNPK
ncbi:MAG: cryptochrome/photolyase family protein [Chitinophagaceae bacterium]|nr:cryptochrome/photolyase family protein [Chitinophagaceae bacterium]